LNPPFSKENYVTVCKWILALAGIAVAIGFVTYSQFENFRLIASIDLVLRPMFVLGVLPPLLCLLKKENRPRLLLLWGLFCVLILLLLIAGTNSTLWLPRLEAGAGAFFLWGSAFCIGLKILNRVLPEPTATLVRFCFSAGLGMIVLSTLTLLLGVMGWMNQVFILILLTGGWICGGKLLVRLCADSLQQLKVDCQKTQVLTLAGTGLLVSFCIAMSLTGFLPPLDYDVTEYHIQLPREYFDAGQITFLPHNLFSGFPQGMEMFTLLSFELMGGHQVAPIGASSGIWMAKLVHLGFLPLLLLSLAATVTHLLKLITKTEAQNKQNVFNDQICAGLLGAILLIGCLATMTLSMKLYTEIGMATFTLLAYLAVIHCSPGNPVTMVILSGCFAGMACCCKYTGLLFVGFPAALAVAFITTGLPFKKRLGFALLCGLTTWVILSPWLIKNGITTGNPVYPLFNDSTLLEMNDWSAAQTTRFQQAHRATHFSFASVIAESLRLLIGGKWVVGSHSANGEWLGLSGLIFLPGLFLFSAKHNSKPILIAGSWLISGFFMWYFFSHRVERFFYPVYVLGCVIAAVGWGLVSVEGYGCARKRVVSLAINSLGFCCILLTLMTTSIRLGATYGQPTAGPDSEPVLAVLLGEKSPLNLLRRSYMPWSLREGLSRENISGNKVLLIGTADPFWLPSGAHYAVVFSKHRLWKALNAGCSAAEIRRALLADGITHLYFNWYELARLHNTYAFAYDLTPKTKKQLRQLLTSEIKFRQAVLLSRPWRLSEVADRNQHVRKLLLDYQGVLGAGMDGIVGLGPYELYELR